MRTRPISATGHEENSGNPTRRPVECARKAVRKPIRSSGRCSRLPEPPCSPTGAGPLRRRGAGMNNVYLLFPELLLLLVPLLFLLFWRGRASGPERHRSSVAAADRRADCGGASRTHGRTRCGCGRCRRSLSLHAGRQQATPDGDRPAAGRTASQGRSSWNRHLWTRCANRAPAGGTGQCVCIRPAGRSGRQQPRRRYRSGRKPDSARTAGPSDCPVRW